MKLGLVTYQIGSDWDVSTLIENCARAGFEGVEARTGHAHGIEEGLSADERREVKARFDESPVALYGLGTAFEFHSPDASEVEADVEGAKRYAQLAADVGAEGIKVRPNGVREDVPREESLEQIGRAFGRVARAAADLGVKVWMEVHGPVTSDPVHMPAILAAADHPNALVCWNCNAADRSEDGSVAAKWEPVAKAVDLVHIHDLYDERDYPWSELFALLRARSFDGWTALEGPGSADGLRVMRYYSKVWESYATGEES